MWFRNLQIYHLKAPFELSPEALHEAMQEKISKPCGGLDTHRIGWTTPLGKNGDQLVHATNGRIMVCMRREERVLPAAVVKDVLAEKTEAIETQEGRSVGRKERNQIKDDIVVDLLPRAFTRSRCTFAYIDPINQWVIVDASSASRAEELLELMRESLASFKLKPLAVKNAPSAILTGWVKGGAPIDWEMAGECVLKEPLENGGSVRIKGIDLGSDEVQQHVIAGRLVSQLAVEWQERIACILVDDLSIKRLKLMDLVMEEAADTATDDPVARFDGDFALMAMELSRFIPALIEQLGGIEELTIT